MIRYSLSILWHFASILAVNCDYISGFKFKSLAIQFPTFEKFYFFLGGGLFCQYFQYIIVFYNSRPARPRWIGSPRPTSPPPSGRRGSTPRGRSRIGGSRRGRLKTKKEWENGWWWTLVNLNASHLPPPPSRPSPRTWGCCRQPGAGPPGRIWMILIGHKLKN